MNQRLRNKNPHLLPPALLPKKCFNTHLAKSTVFTQHYPFHKESSETRFRTSCIHILQEVLLHHYLQYVLIISYDKQNMYIPVNCGGSAVTFRFWMGPCLSSSRFGGACTHYHVQANLASSLQGYVWRTQLSQSSSIQHHKQLKHHKLAETQRQIWAMFWSPGSFWISVHSAFFNGHERVCDEEEKRKLFANTGLAGIPPLFDVWVLKTVSK